jgi:hypothetical protein
MKYRAMGNHLRTQPLPWGDWVEVEQFRRSAFGFSKLIHRTYFVAFCCFVQLQMLYDLPTPLALSDLEFPLPCAEEEWFAENEEKWKMLRASDTSPPTPFFHEALQRLFEGNADGKRRYSEFGGYIMISGLLFTILDAYRISRVPVPTVAVEFSKLDTALDTWQTVWDADPKSHISGPSSAFGAIAFNAAVVYRAASVRRTRDYSKYASDFCTD